MKHALAILFIFWAGGPAAAEVSDGSGLKLSGNVDIVGQSGFIEGDNVARRIDVREAEVTLYGAVDHLFDAQFALAAHQEGPSMNFVVHEAFLGSSKLIPRSRFRVGQFFLGIGRLNQFHRHDWPFITAPKVQQEFFDSGAKEGAFDTGLEYSYLLPTPFFLELTVGLTNGWIFGHSHTLGLPPVMPTHYVRAVSAISWEEGGAQFGLNYVGRKSNSSESMTLLGLDLVMKWREENTVKWLLQSEIWYRTVSPTSAKNAIGLYVFPQYHLGQGFFLGIRGDFFSVTNLTNAFGEKVANVDYLLIPTFTWKPSEFSTFRLAFDFGDSRQAGNSLRKTATVEAQAVFILGAHPAHDF